MGENQLQPGRRDPEGRRRAILAAAAELIAEHGAAALTHRAVAARAGVSLGSTTQYFASIDEMREAALQQLADEIDEELAALEPLVAEILDHPEAVVEQLSIYLRDSRVVHSDIALMTSATADRRLRPLALRWQNRVIEMLAQHIGRECAVAIAVYIDGATIHAGLHDEPLAGDHLARALRALATMPEAPPEGSGHTSPPPGARS